jgi:Transglutaminase-like superfamily
MAARFFASLCTVAGLSSDDWLFLRIAVKELALARMRHAYEPIDAIFRDLQTSAEDFGGPHRASPLTLEDLRRMSWAIAAAASRVPWRSDCLVQAMAAHRWLRRDGMRADAFVGVCKNERGDLMAHAWLRQGDLTITGGHYDKFQVMVGPSSFVS